MWKLAEAKFPERGLEEPGPGREYWIIKGYGTFSLKYKMYSKNGMFVRSVVALELPGRVADIDLLRSEYAPELMKIGAAVVPAGNSAAIRLEVPCARPPVFDESVTRAALRAWAKLLGWWQAKSAAQRAPSAAGRCRGRTRAAPHRRGLLGRTAVSVRSVVRWSPHGRGRGGARGMDALGSCDRDRGPRGSQIPS